MRFRAMEKRKEPRTRTLKKAKIVFNNGRSVIDCIVRNLSAHGALLVVHSLLGVPDTFELHIESDGSRRVAHTKWKREGKIGVELEPPE
jgi:hypothetical protein